MGKGHSEVAATRTTSQAGCTDNDGLEVSILQVRHVWQPDDGEWRIIIFLHHQR